MKKVEQYIKEHTKETCSPVIDWDGNIAIYKPWLTIDDARRVAEIAREETIKEVYEWIKYNNENGGCLFDGWENDLKKYLEDKA